MVNPGTHNPLRQLMDPKIGIKQFEELAKEQERQKTFYMSGLIVSPQGLICAPLNELVSGQQVRVIFSDGATEDAPVIFTDNISGLAMIKAPEMPPVAKVAKLGDSSRVRRGQQVFFLGSPLGLQGSLTPGLISAVNRDMNDVNQAAAAAHLQISTSLPASDPGEAVFDLNGEVVGLWSSVMKSGGISFAIPSNTVADIAGQIISKGFVERGRIGVSVENIPPDVAANYKLSRVHGAFVEKVDPSGPAHAAGIVAGDIITAVDNKVVEDAPALSRIVSAMSPNQSVDLDVVDRRGQRRVNVKIGRSVVMASNQASPPRVDVTELAELGMGVAEEGGGVVIKSVSPGGPAARQGLAVGSLITHVNLQKVSGTAGLVKDLQLAKQMGAPALLLTVQTSAGKKTVTVPIK